jgi:hypothetical protein
MSHDLSNIPQKWRKKPVKIEAFQLVLSVRRVCEWIADAMDEETVRIFDDRIEIHTREGVMTATAGDWIIQGVKGEIYPCKPDIFAATYDDADCDR